MAVDKEYWNIPKSSEDFLTTQGANLTVFVDRADNALVWGLGASDVTAIAGVFIASFAFIASLWQAYMARKHNRLMVTPHITISRTSSVDNRSFDITIKNNGIGPALIDEFTLTVAGKKLSPFVVDKALFEDNFECLEDVSLSQIGGSPYFMPSATSRVVIRLIFNKIDDGKLENILESTREKIGVEVSYTDIYRKRFPIANTKTLTP